MNNTDFNWIEIKVIAEPVLLEELSPDLFEAGFEGITEQSDSFLIYVEESNWGEPQKNQLFKILARKNIAENKIEIKRIKNQNWNENWKANFKVFKVGKNIVVQPDWENYQIKQNETLITIAPKMAFGTGHHETTKLILEQLENLSIQGARVLDAGTGSGILAIYAAKKGAEKVVAFDNDPQAIINAEENCALNQVKNNIELICCDIDDIKKTLFDIIIANINRNVLLKSPEKFKNIASISAKLVLSGLLLADEKEIVKAYKVFGWQLENTQRLGEWVSLIFK